MIIRRVDSDNDWTFGKGISDYAKDEDAIDQNIRSRILSWVGDCFFAPQEGVDWKGRLEIGQQDLLVQEIKSAIVRSFGVASLTSITPTFIGRTRALNIEYSAQTIFSKTLRSIIQQSLGS